jgi:subtilase family serine protease
MPLTYGSQYDLQSSSVSLTLSQGRYWLYAWSANNTTLDSSLSLTQQPYQAGGFSLPVAYLIVAIIVALGIFVIALAILILTRRVWR